MASMSHHDRAVALDDLAACLRLSSLAELRTTLAHVDVMISAATGEPATEVVLLAFAELLATEVELHDAALDRELQSILDARID
jgi:hypothetical protein